MYIVAIGMQALQSLNIYLNIFFSENTGPFEVKLQMEHSLDKKTYSKPVKKDSQK